MGFEIKDNKGRVIIKVSDDNDIAIARFPDMEDDVKDCIVEYYTEMTGECADKVRKFLDFKEGEDEFCS